MTAPDKTTPVLNLRKGQKHFLKLTSQFRTVALVARRQWGKTTVFAAIALKKMMKKKGHTVIFGSAKLNLSREIVRKEAGIMQSALIGLALQAQAAKGQLQILDSEKEKAPDVLTADDFAEIFEAQRLECRFYHSRNVYSRTKVVALRPDTVGETGDLMCDEIGRVAQWAETWEAINPIIMADPTFICTLATTPPPDDTHLSFAQLAPPPGMEFPINAAGNLYETDMGFTILRVDAFDAFADGVPMYDIKTGAAMSPAEHRKKDPDKGAWDRNFGCKFILGGAAACGLMQLDTAQARGVGKCAFFYIDDDLDFVHALAWLHENLGPGTVGLGWDTATTEKGTSNPSSFSIVEQVGVDLITRAILVWKTKDPDVAEERAKLLVKAVEDRKVGGRARRIDIDATNEKYFASRMKKVLAPFVQVELIVGSEKFDKPGFEPTNYKQHLGSLLVGELDDNHLTLPSERYVREDFRLVMKERGAFVCEPDAEGRHGDTFDSTKLAIFALKGAPPPPLPRSTPNSRRGRVIARRRDRTAVAA